ncbi:MAG TPA: hypothetical protein RMH99_23610 [Sandaracinaceae bacterium LLY-WYZ-13_1]|nr:hypothetical protein [Sandaracinaceae bacterium LLY-WYZ-13_1]
MTALAPCPACDRHLRIDERACPFCGAGVVLAPAPTRRPGRLGRAAYFAFRAAVVGAGGVTAAACGSATGLEDPSWTADGATPAAGDAGEPTDDAGPHRRDAGAVDAGTDGAVIALYGGGPMPAPVDAGAPAPADAGADDRPDAGGVMNLYGAPPPPIDPSDAGPSA